MFHKKFRYIAPRLGRFRYYDRLRIFDFYRERRVSIPLPERIRLIADLHSINVIPFMDIDVTTYCNLKCKYCTHYSNIVYSLE